LTAAILHDDHDLIFLPAIAFPLREVKVAAG